MNQNVRPTEQELPLASIVADQELQARHAGFDPDALDRYTEDILNGDTFPPVVVFYNGRAYWLTDGFHRHEAHNLADRTTIRCLVYQGTREDAAWYAAQANRKNGVSRKRADARRAIRIALKARPNLADSAVAQHVGVSDKTVAAVRREMEATSEIPKLTARVGLDGRTQETTNIRGQGTPDFPKCDPAVPDPPAWLAALVPTVGRNLLGWLCAELRSALGSLRHDIAADMFPGYEETPLTDFEVGCELGGNIMSAAPVFPWLPGQRTDVPPGTIAVAFRALLVRTSGREPLAWEVAALCWVNEVVTWGKDEAWLRLWLDRWLYWVRWAVHHWTTTRDEPEACALFERLTDEMFRQPDTPDPFDRCLDARDRLAASALKEDKARLWDALRRLYKVWWGLAAVGIVCATTEARAGRWHPDIRRLHDEGVRQAEEEAAEELAA